MGRRRISETPAGARHRGRGHENANQGRTRRRTPKRPTGVHVIERGGYFHLHGTIRVKGRGIRVRESTGLPARPEHRDAAEELRRQKEQEIRNAVLYGIRPTVPFAVAAEGYLIRRRKRPLNAIDIARIKELTQHFGTRPLAPIGEEEWAVFIDERMSGRAAVTRERYIDLVMSFLAGARSGRGAGWPSCPGSWPTWLAGGRWRWASRSSPAGSVHGRHRSPARPVLTWCSR